MIFLTEKISQENKIEVIVYDNLEDLSQSVECQDILDDSLIILDDQGKIYGWDDSRRDEVGTTYHYSFKVIAMDFEFAEKCLARFNALGQFGEFEIEVE